MPKSLLCSLCLALLYGWCLASSGNAVAASYDCNKAARPAEKRICGDRELSELDAELSTTYAEALFTVQDKTALRQDQLSWLRKRNRCLLDGQPCGNYADVLRARIARLRDLACYAPYDLRRPSSAAATCTPAGGSVRPFALYDRYTLPQEGIAVSEDQIIFSVWNHSGNTEDVVALDPTTGHESLLAKGEGFAAFLDRDARYVIISDNAPVRYDADQQPIFTNYIVLLNRATGEIVKRTNVSSPASWARIHGDHVIVMEHVGLEVNSFDRYGARAVIFSLPSMEPVAQSSVHANATPQLWRDLVVTLDNHQVVAVGQDLLPRFTIDVPPSTSPPANRYTVCHLGAMKVYGDSAVVADECGGLAVVDLQGQKVKWAFPTETYTWFTAVGDVLLATQCTNNIPVTDQHHIYRTPDRLRAYGLRTGRRYADVPIPRLLGFEQPNNFCVNLDTVGNRLLEAGFPHIGPSTLAIFDVDAKSVEAQTFPLAP